MSVSRKIRWHIAAVLIGVALLGSVTAIGLAQLSNQYNRNDNEYHLLRGLYEVGHHARTARQLARSNSNTAQEDAHASVVNAWVAAQQLLQPHNADTDSDTPTSAAPTLTGPRRQSIEQIEQLLRSVLESNTQPTNPANIPNLTADAANQTLQQITELAAETNQQIIAHRSAAAHAARWTLIAFCILGITTVASVALLGINLWRAVVDPVLHLAQATERYAAGDLSARIHRKLPREFAELAQRFNHMADAIETTHAELEHRVEQRTNELIRTERLAGVGRLAAGVAHEINNPLALITGYAEAALAYGTDDQLNGPESNKQMIAQHLRVITDEAFRAKRITGRLLTLARPADQPADRVKLNQLVAEAVTVMRELPDGKRRAIDFSCSDDPIELIADAVELRQLMTNVLLNAIQATEPASGRISVTLERRADESVICVRDNGVGLAAEDARRVFEPFFSRRRNPNGTPADAQAAGGIAQAHDVEGGGHGLGLTVCQAIVERHGGWMEMRSDGPGRGATVEIGLPVGDTVCAPQADERESSDA